MEISADFFLPLKATQILKTPVFRECIYCPECQNKLNVNTTLDKCRVKSSKATPLNITD